MDRSGVAMGLVSSTPDEGTIMLWEYAPNRIVPELRPYFPPKALYGEVTSSDWTSVPGIEDYLKERLEKYPHLGIGEFHIRSEAMWNEPLMRKVIALAKERDIPLCAFRGRRPLIPTHGDQLFRSMTTSVARVRKSTVGCVC